MGILEISRQSWVKALEKTLPAKILDVNRRAFQSGFEFGESVNR